MNNKHIKTVVGVAGLVAAMMISPVFAAGHEAAVAGKGPSTNVAWTAEQVRFVAQGDKARGAQLHQDLFCVSCHGNAGIAPSANWPSLAGQRAEYTFKMLKDYKDGKRKGSHAAEIMTAAGQMVSDQDMADLAQFYASFELPALPDGVTFDAALGEKITYMVRRGDGKRLLAPCQSCHVSNGEGQATDTPALAGQSPEYFIKTMQDYKTGARQNDVYSRMRLIAKVLTDEEIVQLAHYYAGLTAK
ncbi:MAG: c-type cytochrome [Halothiobacillaceae bacterium]|nr:c-type cytochrome [Halothiobacillaceae bacterium]